MAQQDKGFLGAVRDYIPGFNSEEPDSEEAHSGEAQDHNVVDNQPTNQGGIMSYIPGFGGSGNTSNTEQDSTAAPRTTRSGTVYNKSADDGIENPNAAYAGNDNNGTDGYKNTTEGYNNPGSGVAGGMDDTREGNPANYSKGSGFDGGDNMGYEQGYKGNVGDSQNVDSDFPQNNATNNEAGAYQADDQGRGQGYDAGNREAYDDGVRGAPIEGDNVKGYAISAPVGTGDVTNLESDSTEPTGQVSGATLQYGPTETDDRDQTGRGTFGRTQGTGDSSFANVKRNIPGGTEHVRTHASSSRIEHTSTTQL